MPDYNFWKERWSNNKIGFHQGKPHPALVKWIHLLKPYKKILVPLCGKSLDMIYLRDHGLDVVGVEFSELAVLDFIKENNLKLEKRSAHDFTIFEGAGIKIYQGDFFKLKESDLVGIHACYDRASMVAFNKSERKKYSELLMKPALDLKIMLAPLLDYGDVVEDGPPFSVTPDELKSLYGKKFSLKILDSKECPIRESFLDRGVTYEKETTWLFEKLES